MKLSLAAVVAATAAAAPQLVAAIDSKAVDCSGDVVAMVQYVLSDSQGHDDEATISSIEAAHLTSNGGVSATWLFADTDCTSEMKKHVGMFLEETFDQTDVVDSFECVNNDASLSVQFTVMPQCNNKHAARSLQLEDSDCGDTDFSEFGLVNGTFIASSTSPTASVNIECDLEIGYTCTAESCSQEFVCFEGSWMPQDVGLVYKNANDEWAGGCVPVTCPISDLDLDGNNYVVPDDTPDEIAFNDPVLINCASGHSDLFWPSYQFQTVYCTDRYSFRDQVRSYCQSNSAPFSTSCPADSGTTLYGQTVTFEGEEFLNGDTGAIVCGEGFEPVGEVEEVAIDCGGENSASPTNPRASLEISDLFDDLMCAPVYCAYHDLDLGSRYSWSIPAAADCSSECYTEECLLRDTPNCNLPYGTAVEVTCAEGFQATSNMTESQAVCMSESGWATMTGESTGLICDTADTTMSMDTTMAPGTTQSPITTTSTDGETETMGPVITDPDPNATTTQAPDPNATTTATTTTAAPDPNATTTAATTTTAAPDPNATTATTTTGPTDPNATDSVTTTATTTAAPTTTDPNATTSTSAATSSTGADTTVTTTASDPNATTTATTTTTVADPNATTATTTAAPAAVDCGTNASSCTVFVSQDWSEEVCNAWAADNDVSAQTAIYREAFTAAINAGSDGGYVESDLFSDGNAATVCGSIRAVLPVSPDGEAAVNDVFGNGAEVAVTLDPAQDPLLFTLDTEVTTVTTVTTTAAPPTAAPTTAAQTTEDEPEGTTTAAPGSPDDQTFIEQVGVGGLAGIIIAIVVIVVLIIVIPIVVCKKKEESEEEEETEEEPNDEQDDDGSENGDENIDQDGLTIHTEASKRLVDGIVEAQMRDHNNMEDDSGEHTTSEDTGIEDFNNDSSTGAAQLIATIIHAIDDVDVPADAEPDNSTSQDPVPVTDATNALIGEVLATSEQDSNMTGENSSANQSTMDSVDPSTESNYKNDDDRDNAYE